MINKKSDIKECRCNFCNTEFFYTENELIDVNEEYIGLICPQCGNQIEICKINNTKFPEDFYYFGNGKNLPDNEMILQLFLFMLLKIIMNMTYI